MPSQPTTNSQEPILVMFVDDETGQRELAKLNIEVADPSMKVTTISAPSEALKTLSENKFDCVISDYQLAEMTGIQLCAEIKAKFATPFIIYTARGSDEIAGQAFAAGVDDYVGKESDLSHYKVLTRRIRHIVERVRTEETLLRTKEDLRITNEALTRYLDSLEAEVTKRIAEVRESREILQAFMNSATEGMMIYDKDLRIIDINDTALSQFPTLMKRGDVLGKLVTEVDPDIGGTTIYQAYLDTLKTGVPYRSEALNELPEGANYFARAVFKVGDGLGVISRDISEKVHQDEDSRHADQMEAISKMMTTVAHGLRGPLGSIVQAVNMIKNDPHNAPKMMSIIEENAVRSLKLIADWRSTTREIKLSIVGTDLNDLVKRVLERITVPDAIRVQMDVRGGLKPIPLDPDIMSRVVDNLIRNGLEAMPRGGKLTVSIDGDKEWAYLKITDSGVGIPEEQRTHMFTPLYTTKLGGMGLGLVYCKKAIEALRGTLEFQSTSGEGTTFTVRLPKK